MYSSRKIFSLVSLFKHKQPAALSKTFPSAATKRTISVFSTSDPNGNNDAWQKAVTEAEKIVGFPTSFLSLRALLSDEFGGLAIHLRKLVNTKHPLLNTARGIVFDSKNYLQTRGLVVLLLSKAARTQSESQTQSSVSEIYKKQHALAEITELIHIAFLVHRGIVDVEEISTRQKSSKQDLEFGNKMAVLGGDFLLANACTCLANLHNTNVVDLMSSAIEDMSTALIILPETGLNCDENSFENIPERENQWSDLFNLAHGSLLSKACHAAMILCNESEDMKKSAGSMAKHLVLAQQAQHDILRMNSIDSMDQKPNFSVLCALPVVIMSEENGGREWVKENFINDKRDFEIDVKSLYKAVKKDQVAMSRSNEVCSKHVDLALNALEDFPKNEATKALTNIILSVKQ